MALAQGKKIKQRAGKQGSAAVGAGVQIFQGAMVMLSVGVAKTPQAQANAGAAAACFVPGIAEQAATGGATDGAVTVPYRAGTFAFKNSSGGDVIAAKDIGQPAYVVDDETVALTSNSSVRPKAGTIVDVTSDGVWVRVGV